MKIDAIYIPCYKLDFRLTRICVASIRHWYPDIPIFIIKDLNVGNFNSSELEKYFNVKVFPQKVRKYGWGFSKFEVFFQEEKKRFLLLDSDAVFVGPILDILEKCEEDWVVFDEPFTQKDLLRYYYDPEKIKALDPEFKFLNFTFNTGQIVGNTWQLKREDFSKFLEWTEPRIQLHREAFTFGGEQPLLNYVLMKKLNSGSVTLKRLNFMREGMNADTAAVSIERLKKKEGYPFLIHWHDSKPGVLTPHIWDIPRRDILLYYEDIYYRRAHVSPLMEYLRKRYARVDELVHMKVLKTYRRFKSFKQKLGALLGQK